VDSLAQDSIKIGYRTNAIYLQRIMLTTGTKTTTGIGATTVWAQGRFQKLKLSTTPGAEVAPHLPAAYTAGREQ